MVSYLEFEKPIAALDTRIAELRAVADGGDIDISAEIERLEAKSTSLLASTYRALTPWQKTRVARHPMRPHFRDYVQALFTDFMPLSGDRRFGEDAAIIGGPARLDGRKVMLIGHEKGHDTQSRLTHNFGMAKPEGYRKAARLMEMAGRFGLPVVTLVDTSGAFPGVEAEERGQAEAIARAIEACLALPVPMVAVIVGEGGSGGAVALVVATAIAMAHDVLGLSAAGGLRAAFGFTAAWWLCFSLPAACARFPAAAGAVTDEAHAASSVAELTAFGRSLLDSAHSNGRHLAAVLGGSMLILGAVQTAIAQFSSVAIEEFDLEPAALVRLVLLVQAVALPGALAVGWLSERVGRRITLGLTLAGWSAVLVLAWFVDSVPQLFALAVLLAVVLGGVQSVIRATVAEAAPGGRAGVTFGLLQVGTKLAGAAAGLTFGSLYLATGQPRAGLSALLVQLLAGWWLLRRMDGSRPRQSSPSTSRIE